MGMESDYIIILCGVFQDNYTPLTRSAFWKLYHKYHDSIKELVESGEESVTELLKRSAAVSFAVEDLKQKGYYITTFLDEDFPERLRTKLLDFCPPLLYTCGDWRLNQKRLVGYVGSRNITEEDIAWTVKRVKENIRDGYGIVTGGAKGIDSVALNQTFADGGCAVLFLPDNIQTKIREPLIQKNLLNGSLLIYSHVSPYAAKTRNSFVASAMERNKYIYAQSVATVVVRSDYGKGGTWAGASEAIKHKWSYVYVWNHQQYQGNQELIRLGGAALSDNGDVVKTDLEKEMAENDTTFSDSGKAAGGKNKGKLSQETEPEDEQLSIFDFINQEE